MQPLSLVIAAISHAGSGCPQGAAVTVTQESPTLLTLAIGDDAKRTRPPRRQACTITVPLKHAAGWRLRPQGLRWGRVSTPTRIRFHYQGAAATKSASFPAAQTCAELPTSWGPCGEQTTLVLQVARHGAKAQLGGDYKLQLVWEKCQ